MGEYIFLDINNINQEKPLSHIFSHQKKIGLYIDFKKKEARKNS